MSTFELTTVILFILGFIFIGYLIFKKDDKKDDNNDDDDIPPSSVGGISI